MDAIASALWPLSRAGEALQALAQRAGLAPRPGDVPVPPQGLARDTVGGWLLSAAGWLGLEAEPLSVHYGELDKELRELGPLLIAVGAGEGCGLLAVVGGGRGGQVVVLAPDLELRRVSPATVREAVCRELEAPVREQIDRLLAGAAIPQRRHERARAGLLQQRLGHWLVGGMWSMRQPPSASFWGLAKEAAVRRRLGVMVGAHAVQYLLAVGAWWVVGAHVLQGRLDSGWLWAWGLMLLAHILIQLWSNWLQGLVAVGVGGLLKVRFLYGALRLKPEEIRTEGAGLLLGRVLDCEALESLAIGGGFLALTALIELAPTAAVVLAAPGGGLRLLLFAGWVAVAAVWGAGFYRRLEEWTRLRLKMTSELVERMEGHRTRLAQEPLERWHEGEDQLLERYVEISEDQDERAARLSAVIPRGWMLLGLFSLGGALFSGTASAGGIAVAMGSLMLSQRVLSRGVMGFVQLATAAVAWRQASPLFHAATRPVLQGSWAAAATVHEPAGREAGAALLEAHELVFRHEGRAQPAVAGSNLLVRRGDRLLLEGSSGAGKSTLATLLSGLREPESGLLLLAGLDRRTLGEEGWRRRVVFAPQFHDNHVMAETFAFNLLMGRQWPPTAADMQEAQDVCAELELGPLLTRMPAGLMQLVGDTGWQLSHGERSRLYLARALLQKSDMVILDESFAALDPETLRRCLDAALRRAPTLMVIAHP